MSRAARLEVRDHRKADGRYLLLYGTTLHTGRPLTEAAAERARESHLRWHPLRGEWVMYAPHRQERTFLPSEAVCPLCPSRPGGPPTEIPFEDFEVAVFENRFPALTIPPGSLPSPPVEVAPAVGACEVVVYAPAHRGSLATLAPERRELLLRVWAHRYQALYAHEAVQCVMPFENRGEIVGVTLHHPHGQIYAYPFVPPVLQAEAAAFRREPVLSNLVARAGAPYVVEEDGETLALAPPFGRFPYEIWVFPRDVRPGPWTLDDAEVASMARMLGRTAARYDALFGRPMPYVMALHAAPKGEERSFHFHVEFYPFLRAAERQKYLAGTEVAAGAFTVDVLPEEAARTLRQIAL
jgi:UDPglucose--hexose-1-phosphate uridylyltransferase